MPDAPKLPSASAQSPANAAVAAARGNRDDETARDNRRERRETDRPRKRAQKGCDCRRIGAARGKPPPGNSAEEEKDSGA